MARISEFHLENVRCFEGRQAARTSRITLLVGPNSSGKSTFLGCYKTFAELANLHSLDGKELDDKNYFDTEPYNMGSFDTIASSGKSEFTLEGKFENHCHAIAGFKFVEAGGSPLEQEVFVEPAGAKQADDRLTISRPSTNSEQASDIWKAEGPDFSFDIDRKRLSYFQVTTWLSRLVRRGYMPAAGESEEQVAKLQNFVTRELKLDSSPWFAVQALEPMPEFPRQRLYSSDPIKLSDGDINLVRDIGKKAKLWSDVSVDWNKAEGGYQINVKTPGGVRNLIDVGFGVYSLLPYVKALSKTKQPTTFLLQQPEVHLHPESQAELARWMVESEHEFLLETHSEHFIDRFRICVMRGLVDPKNVSIIYFENQGNNTVLHDIGVDKEGNLTDVPKGYHDFFKKEANLLLGFDKEF